MKYILFIGIFFLFSFKHPFYLGVVDLKYNAPQKSMQCAVKLFTNDLEDALKKITKGSVDLINIKDTVKVEKLLNKYISERLILKINGTARTYEFIGFEREEEATWMYIEYAKCDLPQKIEVRNTLLYDHLQGQTNIVHVEIKEVKKSLKASNPDKDFIFLFP